ncbi:hypothetical protein ACFL1H_06410, partial [Nanoarchaeota archaeon]
MESNEINLQRFREKHGKLNVGDGLEYTLTIFSYGGLARNIVKTLENQGLVIDRNCKVKKINVITTNPDEMMYVNKEKEIKLGDKLNFIKKYNNGSYNFDEIKSALDESDISIITSAKEDRTKERVANNFTNAEIIKNLSELIKDTNYKGAVCIGTNQTDLMANLFMYYSGINPDFIHCFSPDKYRTDDLLSTMKKGNIENYINKFENWDITQIISNNKDLIRKKLNEIFDEEDKRKEYEFQIENFLSRIWPIGKHAEHGINLGFSKLVHEIFHEDFMRTFFSTGVDLYSTIITKHVNETTYRTSSEGVMEYLRGIVSEDRLTGMHSYNNFFNDKMFVQDYMFINDYKDQFEEMGITGLITLFPKFFKGLGTTFNSNDDRKREQFEYWFKTMFDSDKVKYYETVKDIFGDVKDMVGQLGDDFDPSRLNYIRNQRHWFIWGGYKGRRKDENEEPIIKAIGSDDYEEKIGIGNRTVRNIHLDQDQIYVNVNYSIQRFIRGSDRQAEVFSINGDVPEDLDKKKGKFCHSCNDEDFLIGAYNQYQNGYFDKSFLVYWDKKSDEKVNKPILINNLG